MNRKLVLLSLTAAFLLLGLTGFAQSAIVLNEAYSRGTDADPDWVELYNHSDAAVDVGGYLVYDIGGQSGSKAKKSVPAGTTIAPWGFLVIVVDKTGDAADFGLGSGGDKVWLENNAGALIDSVEFGAIQPTESYQRIPDGGAWKLSTPLTRGASNVVVKLNEAFSRGTTADPDWVELYNSYNDTLDISGYKVYDIGGQSGSKPKMTIPAGTLIMPKGFYIVVTDNKADPANFGLGSGGDKVWLEDSTGAVVDSVEFGALTETQSYSRVPDGGLWQISEVVTKGSSNGGASGVATEPALVSGFQLRQNYPNPFNPSTRIEFALARAADVQVTVYGLNGQMVAELLNGRLAAGSHQLTFNAANLASGVYIYTIRSADFSAARRMVLMK